MDKESAKITPLTDAEIKRMLEDPNFDPDARKTTLEDIEDTLLTERIKKDHPNNDSYKN